MLPVSVLWAEYKWAALLLALGGMYALGRHDGAAMVEGEQAREERLVEKSLEASRKAVGEEIGKLEVKHVTVQRAIERETRTVPVYVDCRHSAGGLRGLNAALENRPLPAGAGELPAEPGAAAGR